MFLLIQKCLKVEYGQFLYMLKEFLLLIITYNFLTANCFFFEHLWTHTTTRIKKEDSWPTSTSKPKNFYRKLNFFRLLRKSELYSSGQENDGSRTIVTPTAVKESGTVLSQTNVTTNATSSTTTAASTTKEQGGSSTNHTTSEPSTSSTPTTTSTVSTTFNDVTDKNTVIGRAGKFFQSAAEKASKIFHCLFNEVDNAPDTEISFYLFTRNNPDKAERLFVRTDFLNETRFFLANSTSDDRKKKTATESTTLKEASTEAGSSIFIPLEAINGESQSICFNILSPTKILVHGYTQTCIDDRMMAIKDAYLKKGDYNIIMVEWGKLAAGPCYWTATKHSRIVGNYLGQLLQQMSMTGAMLSTFHVIGFSLGAQVAGFIKPVLTHSTLMRITGLDPALPLFQHTDPASALDSGDARFVDVIHTGGGILGQTAPLGHADFYPNGGCRQPGCDKSVICSHNRALLYFAESITSELGFHAVSCPSWDWFEAKKCNISTQDTPVLMGDPCTQSAQGNYFLRTASDMPFAIPWWTSD